MDDIYLLSAGLEFFFALVSFILLMGCVLEHDRTKYINLIFSGIVFTNMVMNAIDGCVWLWVNKPELLLLMKILSFLSYFLGSAILVLLAYLLIGHISEYRSVARWVRCIFCGLAVLMVGMWILSLFNGMYYYWDENGICQRGDYFWISQSFGIVLLFSSMVLVWNYRKDLGRTDSIILMLYNAVPLLSFVVSHITLWEVTPLYLSITVSLMLYYIVLYVKRGHRVAKQENQIMKQELELVSAETAIMLSQIQPHFLYNTLTAIAQLCVKDPKKAKEMTLKFSEYLRKNMESLQQNTAIPFSKEMEHLQIYLSIEQVRFGDILHIVYDIETTNFNIPVLILQPIVENAVKHGVCQKEEGGTVKVATKETVDSVVIIVCDDGVGFDPDSIQNDGKNHIGLKNIKERLEVLMNGTMTIDSIIGRGTTVTIQIPKEKETI